MSFESQVQRAVQLQNAGDLRGAMALYKDLLPHHGEHPELLIRTAIAALSLGDTAFAQSLASRVLALGSHNGVAHNILGIVEHGYHHYALALAHFEKALAASPQDAQVLVNLSETLNALGRPTEAIRHLEEALRLAPDFTKAHYSMGVTRKALGDFTGAAEMFRSTLDRDPLHADAWRALVGLGQASDEGDIAKMKAAVETLAARPALKAKMLFALFGVHERAHDYGAAYRYLEHANRVYASTFAYDVQSDEAYMSAIADVFTEALFQRLADTPHGEEKPIFIVGMPRSGTTLVEQVLAGHSQVSACGELNFLEGALYDLPATPGQDFPQSARTWQAGAVQGVHDGYIKGVRSLDVATPCFTDKMPENFLFLGVVKLAFPHARIIHCTRNPIDTCLGNYRQLFGGHHPYAYDQSTLVRYYKAYQNLMEHWRGVMGEMILDVPYEDFVDDPKGQSRKITQFCDLAWEPQCMNIRDTQRSVFTASAAQVRDDIHKDYVARWRAYAPYIKVLTDAFPAPREDSAP